MTLVKGTEVRLRDLRMSPPRRPQHAGNHESGGRQVPALVSMLWTPKQPEALRDQAVYLPEKGVVRRGILMGARVRKWQGCTLEGDGPPSPSGSTETMVAVAVVMAKVGPLPTGLRLL